MNHHGLGVLVYNEGPTLQGLRRCRFTAASRRPFTYPQVTQLLELAAIIEALERAHLSAKAQQAEQLATVGSMGAEPGPTRSATRSSRSRRFRPIAAQPLSGCAVSGQVLRIDRRRSHAHRPSDRAVAGLGVSSGLHGRGNRAPSRDSIRIRVWLLQRPPARGSICGWIYGRHRRSLGLIRRPWNRCSSLLRSNAIEAVESRSRRTLGAGRHPKHAGRDRNVGFRQWTRHSKRK